MFPKKQYNLTSDASGYILTKATDTNFLILDNPKNTRIRHISYRTLTYLPPIFIRIQLTHLLIFLRVGYHIFIPTYFKL